MIELSIAQFIAMAAAAIVIGGIIGLFTAALCVAGRDDR